jgi:NAD-dependent DNA ligase
LQQSAAAQGNLLTGGTAQALDAYGQNLASTNYQNTYNTAYNTYATNYNQYEQQQTNEYNRLASIAGMGQTTAQNLGTLGQSASNNVTSNLLGTGQQIGQDYQNAAAANASGVVGSANAWSGALGSSTSGISNLLLLNQLQGAGQGASDLSQVNNLSADGGAPV